MRDGILFLLFNPVSIPAWIYLIAWAAFKLNVFSFLKEKELDLPDWDDPIYKDD